MQQGLCHKHGAMPICKVEGCNCKVRARVMCRTHDGVAICKVEGCKYQVRVKGGLCRMHGDAEKKKKMNEASAA